MVSRKIRYDEADVSRIGEFTGTAVFAKCLDTHSTVTLIDVDEASGHKVRGCELLSCHTIILIDTNTFSRHANPRDSNDILGNSAASTDYLEHEDNYIVEIELERYLTIGTEVPTPTFDLLAYWKVRDSELS